MKNFKDALLVLALLVIPSVSNAQSLPSMPPSLETGKGNSARTCKDDALKNLSAKFEDWCRRLCNTTPNNGLETFKFPAKTVRYPVEPYYDTPYGDWKCQAQVDVNQIICECIKPTPPPTPTPSPTPIPSGIYEQKLETVIFGENELLTQKE